MRIGNKKATYDYTLLDRYEAGIHLTGPEVKSLRGGHGKLEGSHVRIIGDEVFLINAHIYPYEHARVEDYDPKRTRKLLMHKKEITSLKGKIEGAKLALVPVAWYTKGPRVKLEIAIARGKKEYDKREKKKRRDIERDIEREHREKVK